MLNLKSCPRCNGDMYADYDVYGRYTHCLQCGHYIQLRDDVTIDNEALLQVFRSARKDIHAEDSDLVASAR